MEGGVPTAWCEEAAGERETILGGGTQRLNKERRLPKEERYGKEEGKTWTPRRKWVTFPRLKGKLKRNVTSEWREESHTSRKRCTQNPKPGEWRLMLETNLPGREYAGIGAGLGEGRFAPMSLWERPGHFSRFEDIATPWGSSSKPQRLFSHSNNYWNCVSSRNTGLVAPDAVDNAGSQLLGHLGSTSTFIYVSNGIFENI